MNLTPEEKAIGKENFEAAVGSRFTRREFLLGGVAAGLVSGAGLGAYYFGYGKSVGDPVRVGLIGTGDEGGVLIGAHNPNYLNVVAIADIRPYSIHRAFHGDQSKPSAYAARPGLMRKYDWTEKRAREEVKVYDQDYHDLLKDPDVEAVVIALPLHLHAKVAIEAMNAGKHVLTEKLMGHSVRECKEMARAAAETKKLLATGHQRHYSILYDNAVETIRSGLLGELHHIRAQWHRGNLPGRDSWQPWLPAEAQEEIKKLDEKIADLQKQTPNAARVARMDEFRNAQALYGEIAKDIDVDAEKYGYAWKDGYDPELREGGRISPLEELIRWRLFDRTGGGLMAELGSHQLDAAGIFITAMRNANLGEGQEPHKALPLSVTATGGRHLFPHDRDVDDHVYCTFEYPGLQYDADDTSTHHKKLVVTYSSINGNNHGGYGEVVMGTAGTLILEQEQDYQLFGGSSTRTKVSVEKNDDGDVVLSTQASSEDAAVGKSALDSGPISRGYTEELEHWAWCVRNPAPENQPKCKPSVALADAVIALTTNIAIREGRRIEFQKEWFDVNDDATPEGGEKPDPSRYARS